MCAASPDLPSLVILEGSEAAKDLSKSDLTKRMKAHSEKMAKLAKPHFYISRTRLCVRNLPTAVDEKKLKTLFLEHAANPTAKITQVGNRAGDPLPNDINGPFVLCCVLKPNIGKWEVQVGS